MLGLQKQKVSIQPYDSKWSTNFKSEKDILLKSLKIRVIDIIHFGSTSVRSCPAKPILDIAIVIRKYTDALTEVRVLKEVGYGNGKIHVLPDRICFTKQNNGIVSHHLYFVSPNSRCLSNWKTVKYVLLNYPEEKAKYIALKKKLEEMHPSNRLEYTKGKTAFISNILNNYEKLS